ncbi:hypothetical protein G6011_06211 [Alternaria panax]|uniref:Uncharacterized protein n=1 Tax=Alternaria panax TaxID=48097 RepID=A0AAD4I7V9_9PLEO|nr:hypothetical protein G6011_06211 [Alternaria panax]
MESAHLVQAHDHARTAATATSTNSVATAGQEHDLAATAFHNAQQDTHDAEARRILSLLEDHHRKLAGLIKEAPRKEKKTTDATKHPSESSTLSSSATNSSSQTAASNTPSPTPPTSRRRLPQSSIATNLAEKRGIPSAKRTTSGASANVPGAVAGRSEQLSTPVRDLLAQQSRKAEPGVPRDATKQPKDASLRPASPPAEDNFSRFYSAFGGVISAISAPLAFTSLPLNPAAPSPVSETHREGKSSRAKSRSHSPEASRTVKSSVPDLAALISKPALRALREDGAPGPNESFYLVPTSSGGVTYASVLRDPNATNASPNTPLNAIDEGSGSLRGSSHEEFVDARENVGPPSPTKARRPPSRGNSSTAVTAQRSIPAGRGSGLKTMEELALENDTLKTVIDKQAKRIQMWELNSQNSFNALAQSFRTRGPGRGSSDPNALAQALAAQGINHLPAPPSPPIPGQAQQLPTSSGQAPTAAPDSDAAKRIADLEAMLASQNAKVNDLMSNNEKLAKQNERNTQVLSRYREQWEKLKAGARKKEQERRDRKFGDGKVGESTKDSDIVEAQGEGEEDLEDEPGFGKA